MKKAPTGLNDREKEIYLLGYSAGNNNSIFSVIIAVIAVSVFIIGWYLDII